MTLGGELIVESGAVSGGGQGPPKSGRMKIGSRAPTMEDPAALEARPYPTLVSTPSSLPLILLVSTT